MNSDKLQLSLGVKSDPIEYRYSFEWLFDLLADEHIQHVQLGTWFEMYRLPDRWFQKLARQAQDRGIQISSVFTSHRELGGLFQADSDWQETARVSYMRLIEIGALVGASSVGSNPGATMRDQMNLKTDGICRYLDHMKGMMRYAYQCGVSVLTIEPMSCLAEPPTLPDEIFFFADELNRDHLRFPNETVPVRYCADISHGFLDAKGVMRYDNYQLMEACLPYIHEIHLRNTDDCFDKTFGFTPQEQLSGVVDIAMLRRFLFHLADYLPERNIIGYLEIGGPKTGRDYSDYKLEAMLRGSLAYLKETFLKEASTYASNSEQEPVLLTSGSTRVAQ